MLSVGLENVCFSRLHEDGTALAETYRDDNMCCVLWFVLYCTLLSAYVGKYIEFVLGVYT